MNSIERQNLRRLQCLFEHACAQSKIKAIFNKNGDNYSAPETEQLFSLWLAGHAQGVADHAVARGDIQL